MALSGSFKKTVGTYRQLIGEWTAKQDIVKNTSTITLKTYWKADSIGAINTDVSKTIRSNVNGTIKTGTNTLELTSNQKRLLITQEVTLQHRDDGTLPTVDLGVYIQIGFSLNKTYYSSAEASGTATLPDIPRQSSLTLPSGWRVIFGESELPVTWNRPSSNYTHKLELKAETSLNDNNVTTAKTVWSASNLTTSANIALDPEICESIVVERDTAFKNDPTARYNGYLWLVLTTYNGSEIVGTHTVRGVFEFPGRSTINEGYADAGTYTAGKAATLERMGNVSPYDLRIFVTKDAIIGTTQVVETIDYFNDYKEWTPNTAIYNPLVGATNDSIGLYFQLESSWLGPSGTRYIIRGEPTVKPITMLKSKNPPIWSKYPTLTENSPSVQGVINASGVFIQGLSNIQIGVSTASAAGQDGTKIVKYRVLYQGVEKNSYTPANDGTAVTFYTYITPNIQGTDGVTVEAIDSNGVASSRTVNFTVLQYTAPNASASKAVRLNGYSGIFDVYAGGTLSPLIYNGVARNSIQSIKVSIGKTLSTLVDKGTVAVDTTKSSGSTYVSQLKRISDMVDAEADTYYVKIEVADKFKTNTITIAIPPGIPLAFFDKDKGSVGFGKFPVNVKSIETPFTFYSAGVNATGNIRTDGALHSTAGKLWIGGAAEINWDSTNSWLKSTHRIVDSNDKKFWTESDLEIQSGRVNISSIQNKVAKATITFPKPFSGTPRVVVSAVTSVPGSSVIEVSSSGTSSTETTICLYRTSATTNTGIDWVAIYEGT